MERGLILHIPFIDNSRDESGLGLHATIGAGAYQTRTLGGCGYTDGSDDYFSIPHDSRFLLTDLSVGIGFYLIAWGANYARIIDKAYDTGFALCRYNNTDQVCFQVVNQTLVNSVDTIPYKVWTHIMAVRRGAEIKIFVNGRYKNTVSGLSTIAMTSTYAIALGQNRSTMVGGEKTQGYYRDLRLYDYALSDSDVARIANELAKDKSNV